MPPKVKSDAVEETTKISRREGPKSWPEKKETVGAQIWGLFLTRFYCEPNLRLLIFIASNCIKGGPCIDYTAQLGVAPTPRQVIITWNRPKTEPPFLHLSGGFPPHVRGQMSQWRLCESHSSVSQEIIPSSALSKIFFHPQQNHMENVSALLDKMTRNRNR